jgi:hypothetical protein
VEGGVRRLANGFLGASSSCFCGIFPFNPNKKGASRISGRARLFLSSISRLPNRRG